MKQIFYNGGGSKLNEVARSYSDVAPKINQYANFEFVWITDGQGWLSAKNKLEEAFSIIPSVYNLSNLDSFTQKITKERSIKKKFNRGSDRDRMDRGSSRKESASSGLKSTTACPQNVAAQTHNARQIGE